MKKSFGLTLCVLFIVAPLWGGENSREEISLALKSRNEERVDAFVKAMVDSIKEIRAGTVNFFIFAFLDCVIHKKDGLLAHINQRTLDKEHALEIVALAYHAVKLVRIWKKYLLD